jgi:outer membrane protein OmpA-like peptidoglycan-associated protein
MKRGKRMLNIFSIYFDYDSSKITGRAAGQLNMIVATMRRYPTMVIELGAHTDSRGGDAYNLKLSNDRAQSTVDYIVNKGEISRDRISGKGYGETRLLNHCDNEHRYKCTKKEHEINRRSEFVITHM